MIVDEIRVRGELRVQVRPVPDDYFDSPLVLPEFVDEPPIKLRQLAWHRQDPNLHLRACGQRALP